MPAFLDALLDVVFTVPGDGGIDFSAALAELVAADYNGWLVVEAEQDPEKAPPLDYARRGFCPAQCRRGARGERPPS